ncbi:septum formation initiator family protein [Paenibacillus sp. CN-4]|uniref:FtsB family cell division protein n=1 Tax=Paenibacillus nanchangensis TaxID=3348343 RepID=UPI00397DB535
MNNPSLDRKTQNAGDRQGGSASAGAKRRKLIWLATMAVFFGWAGYIFYAQSGLISDKSDELARKQANLQSVEQSMNQLKYEVARLNDKEYIGQLARKWYNMYPQGETAIRAEQSEE